MSNAPLYDITPFTALDYPDHLAAIFWFSKCNMRCLYCYNPKIVFEEGKINTDRALSFLKSRIGLLEAVVLSGGEATLYTDLVQFCRQIKSMGFKIKLDTNGLKPSMLKKLIEESLLDYIALDYKAPQIHFEKITANTQYEKFLDTLQYLIDIAFSFEVRTTVHNDLLTVSEINTIIKTLSKMGYNGNYYLQPFLYTPDTIGHLQEPKQTFDTFLLCDDIEVVWRSI